MCTISGVLTKEDKKYIDSKIEELASLVKSGFDNILTKDDGKAIDKRFDQLEYRMDIIEHKYIGSYDKRLEKVEDDVRIMKTKLKIK